MEKIIKKIRIRTDIEILTGLHIGEGKENVEIGGIDDPVVKVATRENQPFIPGSSLKGKMRCLLEQVSGATSVGNDREVNNLFGFAKQNKPSKLIVRDAYLTKESVEALKKCTALDMPYTENKNENTIDRVSGKAEHPRHIERVPAGACFALEMIINVWDDDNESQLLQMVKNGLNLIENDYLGGSGSRGYGQVRFGELKCDYLTPDNNWAQ